MWLLSFLCNLFGPATYNLPETKNKGPMYTHYYYQTDFTPQQWKNFVDECKQLLDAIPVETDTAGGYYSDEPLLLEDVKMNKSVVQFNGAGELGCERFFIYSDPAKNQKFYWTKTDRKPYDLLVAACLIAAVTQLEYKFASDAFNRDETCEDLQPAIDFYNKVLGDEVTPAYLAAVRREYYELDRPELTV
jgi:hypothetical protein